VSGARVIAAGVLTGWGSGVDALPGDARAAAAGRRVIALPVPPRAGERSRRATRECLLGVAAVDAMLADGGLGRAAIAGPGTALLYATAGAYGASNRAFVERAGGTLHFPYTAPSAVPAEVAIEFGLKGAYVILIGGATATLDALAHAALLLARGACARALVLAVETFEECAELYGRARWLLPAPLVEAAAAVLLEGEGETGGPGPGPRAPRYDAEARRRAGETLAVSPLIALALARRAGAGAVSLGGWWRGRQATLEDIGAGGAWTHERSSTS
jgi:hypothetical protein